MLALSASQGPTQALSGWSRKGLGIIEWSEVGLGLALGSEKREWKDSTWMNRKINLSMVHRGPQIRSRLLHMASYDELGPASLFCLISSHAPAHTLL